MLAIAPVSEHADHGQADSLGMLQRVKAQAKQDGQVAPDLVSKPGNDKGKDAASEAVSEPVLKPEIKAAAKPKTKGADGRREAAEARREAAKKARPSCHRLEHRYASTAHCQRECMYGDAGLVLHCVAPPVSCFTSLLVIE